MTAQRILFHDNVIPFVGSWSYLEAFRRAGHNATFVSKYAGIEKNFTTLTGRAYLKFAHDIPERDRARHHKLILNAADEFRPSIFISAGGHYIGADLIRELRRRAIWTVNLNHDDFFSQFRSNWTLTQRKAIPAYNQILTTREVNVSEIRPLNRNVCFFPFAFDPNIHCVVDIPSEERERWEVDVVFVGQWARHRGEMLGELVQRLPARYAVHGPSWENLSRNSPLRPFASNTHVWGPDMAKALGGAKVALGFLRKENRDEFTQRTFEIPACGGTLLAERTSTHQRYFQEGVSAEFFDSTSIDELTEKLDLLLSDDTHRNSVRDAGFKAVRESNNTYDDRVATILKMFRERAE